MSLHTLPLHLFVLVLAVTILAGCDTVTEDDTAVLPRDEPTVRFSFDPKTFSSGDIVEGVLTDGGSLSSHVQEQLETELNATTADIENVTLTSASLELNFPLNQTLDFLDEAELRLLAEGRSPVVIATQDAFSGDRTASLVPTGANLAPLFRAGGLQLQLVLRGSPDVMDATGDYELEVEPSFRIEVAL